MCIREQGQPSVFAMDIRREIPDQIDTRDALELVGLMVVRDLAAVRLSAARRDAESRTRMSRALGQPFYLFPPDTTTVVLNDLQILQFHAGENGKQVLTLSRSSQDRNGGMVDTILLQVKYDGDNLTEVRCDPRKLEKYLGIVKEALAQKVSEI